MYLLVLALGGLLVETTAAAAAAEPAKVSQGFAAGGCWPETHLQTPSSVTLQVGPPLTIKFYDDEKKKMFSLIAS